MGRNVETCETVSASIRNASVAAIAYEFLFEIHRVMKAQQQVWPGSILPSFVNESGARQQAFDHEGMSCWEWITDALKSVGLIKALNGRLSYPMVGLAQCEFLDLSRFESFDNYCYMMFSFEQLHHQFDPGEVVDLNLRSPRFVSAVADEDDIFLFERSDKIIFNESRYAEKVLTRWREMDVRKITPRD
jgi:hypothetical protein